MASREKEDEVGRQRDEPSEEDAPASPSAADAAGVAGGIAAGDDSDLPSPDDLRQMANRCFASGDYDTALPLYGLAVDSIRREMTKGRPRRDDDGAGEETPETTSSSSMPSPSPSPDGGEDDDDDASSVSSSSLVVHLCNRSACLYRMERYEEARDDARDAVRLSGGKNAKASFRLARTQIALGLFDDAVSTLDDALRNLAVEEEKRSKPSATATENSDEGKEEERQTNNLELQRNELTKLRTFAVKKKKQRKQQIQRQKEEEPVVPKCVKTEDRKPSIREFELGKELGVGNFSRVVTCRHKVTDEKFALKIIEKKKAESLAKRQHPNVYNEIEMERRVLTERLPAGQHPYLVNVYHAFQDYGSLYFLMDLHVDGGDLWSSMRYRNKMVGCHPSLVRTYVYEVVDALEYIHSHGIVHRDLKAENVLLSASGHVVLIDFGTAKDLIKTDLNGPEFVGTPDFMSPEAVKGSSGEKETEEEKRKGNVGADHTADLWALGAVTYQLLTGTTPFASPSPYLTFLRIQRGNLRKPWGMGDDDDAWDFVRRLMKVEPTERLGADRFELTTTAAATASTGAAKSASDGGDGGDGGRTMMMKDGGYDVLRDHPYLRSVTNARRRRRAGVDSTDETTATTPIPSLRDLCVRSVAELVELDSENVDVDDEHPPGDGSSRDMLRLNPEDRTRVMHVLDRLKLLSVPRVYRRFFKERRRSKLDKVRRGSRDYVGLTQLNDGQGRWPSAGEEENADPEASAATTEPVRMVHVTNPLFVKSVNDDCVDDEDRRKAYVDELKDSVRAINRTRPKAAIASGYIDDKCRKILAKINESIPVILNDGSTYFSFWMCGAQGLVLRSKDFVSSSSTTKEMTGTMTKSRDAETNGDGGGFDNDGTDDDDDQRAWLAEELEQSRTARHQTFAFVDSDPRSLPEGLLLRLARGRTLCLFGVTEEGDAIVEERTYDVAVAKERKKEGSRPEDETGDGREEEDEDDDDFSAGSVDSVEDEGDAHTMKIVGRRDKGLRSIVIEEHGGWNVEDV